jgi:hypothetical protein
MGQTGVSTGELRQAEPVEPGMLCYRQEVHGDTGCYNMPAALKSADSVVEVER